MNAKEYPLLMKPDMILAYQAGTKTQTRRLVRPQPGECKTRLPGKVDGVFDYCTGDPEKGKAYYSHAAGCWHSTEPFRCPYGQPGDHLWFRETFYINLLITGVRAELLRDISAEDCIAEGLSTTMREHDAYVDLRRQFQILWDSLAAPGSRWEDNPWVWVISFEPLGVKP